MYEVNSMPTYDYKCEECNNIFEKLQSITSKPLRKCPFCGKNKLKRLIGKGSGIIFKKGIGGFYCKDYPKEERNEKTKTDV